MEWDYCADSTLPIHCKMVDTRECVASSVSPGDEGGTLDSLDRGRVDAEREREREREGGREGGRE